MNKILDQKFTCSSFNEQNITKINKYLNNISIVIKAS